MTRCADVAVSETGVDPKMAERILARYQNKSPDDFAHIAEKQKREELFHQEQAETKKLVQELREREHINLIKELADDVQAYDEIKRVLQGNSSMKWGSQNSVAVEMEAQVAQMEARILQKVNLSRKLMREMTSDAKLNDDFVEEMFTPGSSKSPLIRELAESLREERLLNINRINAKGGEILGREGGDPVSAMEFHDPAKLAAMGREKWIDFVDGLQDGAGAQGKQQLGAIYDRLTSPLRGFDGILGNAQTINRLNNDAFASVYFKDAQAWKVYNKSLGHQKPIIAAVAALHKQTRLATLVERLGPDPQRTYNKMKAFAKDRDRTHFTDMKSRELDMIFDHIIGTHHETALPRTQAIVNGILNLNIVSKLGFSPITAVGDIAMASFNLHFQGVKFLSSYARMIKEVIRGQSKEATRDVYRFLNVGADGIFTSGLHRYQLGDIQPGVLTDMADSFISAIGLPQITNRIRVAYQKISAMHMADMTKYSWKDLPKNYKDFLGRSEIGAKEWRVIQKHGVVSMDKLVPSMVQKRKIELTPMEHYVLPDWLARTKGVENQRVARKLTNLFYNEARIGVPEAGLAEKSMMQLGHREGTPAGLALKLIFQFRTPVIRLASSMLPRAKAMGPGFLLHTLPWMGLGYAVLSAKDFLRGRTPRDPTDLRTMLESIAQTGFLGPASDAVTKIHAEGVGKIDEMVLGTTYGEVKDLAKIAGAFWSGEEWGKQALDSVVSNTPGANIWYAHFILNLAVIDGLNETVSPGFKAKQDAYFASRGQRRIFGPQ